MAGASTKAKVIGALWSSSAGIGALYYARYLNGLEEKYPFMKEAAKLLENTQSCRSVIGYGDARVDMLWKQVFTDPVTGLARAKFTIRADEGHAKVFVTARQERKKLDVNVASSYDDLDEEEQTWSDWLSRPWELKLWLGRKIQAVRGLVSSDDSSEKQSAINQGKWSLDTVFFLPKGESNCPITVKGLAQGHPDYEVECLRRDSRVKSETSWKYLEIIGYSAGFLLLVAGTGRIIRARRLQQSYGFAKDYALKHQRVVAAVGEKAIIARSEGTFNPTYINCRMMLNGASKDQVAEVELAASRSNAAEPWRLALARMTTRGSTVRLI